MHSYYLKAVKNYKEVFQLIYTTKIERFNSRLYFYYINNRIDPLTIIVDLSRVPPIIIEGQSYIELPKELQDRTKYIERRERAILLESRQLDTSCTNQPGGRERSHPTRTESPRSPSQVLSKGKERIWSPTVTGHPRDTLYTSTCFYRLNNQRPTTRRQSDGNLRQSDGNLLYSTKFY